MPFNIVVDYDSFVTETSVADSDDSWDRADTYTDWTFGERFYTSDKYGDLYMSYKPETGDTYYVVVVVYSTGDSFGHDEAYGAEWMGIYKTEKEASALEKLILDNESEQSLEYLDGEGNKISMGFVPWHGYFEDLHSVRVLPVRYMGDK